MSSLTSTTPTCFRQSSALSTSGSSLFIITTTTTTTRQPIDEGLDIFGYDQVRGIQDKFVHSLSVDCARPVVVVESKVETGKGKSKGIRDGFWSTV